MAEQWRGSPLSAGVKADSALSAGVKADSALSAGVKADNPLSAGVPPDKDNPLPADILSANALPIVYTVAANCQDCYRCIRACPVKAIRIRGGQAHIDDDCCIKCGTCVRECPQQAKVIRSHLSEAKQLLQSGRECAVSLAPSFAAAYNGWRTQRLPAALRKLGFRYVTETAEGAAYVAHAAFQERQRGQEQGVGVLGRQDGQGQGEAGRQDSQGQGTLGRQDGRGQQGGQVCTACPAVVSYIEKYCPEQLEALMPLVSPMIAHGRLLKQRYPGCAVVFVGPCAAKKGEARRPAYADAVDVVLTFQELDLWLTEEGIDLTNCTEGQFDEGGSIGDARIFPLQGGMLKTGGIACDGMDADVIHLSGADEILQWLNGPYNRFTIVEPLFCKGGCINGPAGKDDGRNFYDRRSDILTFAQRRAAQQNAMQQNAMQQNTAQQNAVQQNAMQQNAMQQNALQQDATSQNAAQCKTLPETVPLVIDIRAVYQADCPLTDTVSDRQIDAVLEKTGKTDPAAQLNCGACGYKTCRENAEAVVRGMAEVEMCIPYMRRLAQQRSDRIIETTPNGVVILDKELAIIHMNPAFQRMFTCNNGILGRRISYLLNADGFEKLLSGADGLNEAIRFRYGIRYHEIAYALREEEQYIGIYSDVSKLKYDAKQLDLVKIQSLRHAQEFLDNQIRFSQEMAHYLGKSTAHSEELVKRLMDLYGEDRDSK